MTALEARLCKALKGTQVYKVFAVAPNEQHSAFEFQAVDNAIRCCFFLTSEGFRIDKVKLPGGREVNGEDILETMLDGIDATRIRLKSA